MSYDPIEIFENESHRDVANDDTILLNIISYDGTIVSLRLSTTITIEELKFQALKNFKVLNTRDDLRTCVHNYKLFKPTEAIMDLNESSLISQTNLSDHGR